MISGKVTGSVRISGAVGGSGGIRGQVGNKSADKNYVHVQSAPSDEWHIKHGLGKRCSVTVVDSGDNVVVGDINYIDNDSLIISFSSAFGGKAYCN